MFLRAPSASFIIIIGMVFFLQSCSEKQEAVAETLNQFSIEDKIAQKIVLDFRRFCAQPLKEHTHCTKTVKSLPLEISKYLSKYPIGGVILFSENIETIEQTVSLTHALQEAALSGKHNIPLLITTDQEGGKVVRLPQKWSTGFAGNMAIAATPKHLQKKYAREIGRIIGTELRALGIHTNHAPNIDVNTNLKNPVINVRSFSDDPYTVSELGAEMANGLQKAKVAATIKHFPGHGDTNTDSHLDLPTVDHSIEQVKKLDLFPFEKIISKNLAPLLMTAHIQYPALDSSTVQNQQGDFIIRPATLSRKIMTDLLRKEMGYKGVTISDAMDMKAISSRWSAADATIMAFKAGVDLSLMPITIHSPENLKDLDQFITDVANAVRTGKIDQTEIDNSVQRILDLKQKFEIKEQAQKPLQEKLLEAEKIFGHENHRTFEQIVADHSVTVVKSKEDGFPVAHTYPTVTIITPSQELSDALSNALRKTLPEVPNIASFALDKMSQQTFENIITQEGLVIAGNVSPGDNLVDLGGMADLAKLKSQSNQDADKSALLLKYLLSKAKQNGADTAFISFRFPAELKAFEDVVDVLIAVYSAEVYVPENETVHWSPTISALARYFSGNLKPVGSLPIDINLKEENYIVGADQPQKYLSILKNKRLGLIVNQSSKTAKGHLVDFLIGQDMKIETLFALEHGIRGNEEAGAYVSDNVDIKTNIPIRSLYQENKEPTENDLKNIDLMVYDIQDVGVRFFTYISSLHNLMEACAEHDVPLLILDRPNPNGHYVDGPILKPEFKSFVGMHPIPLVHGMTVAEIAQMINGEGWLRNGQQCQIEIVLVENYKKSQPVNINTIPSPNLPNNQAIRLYPTLGLFEATDVSIGRGTDFPFQVTGATHPHFGEFNFTPTPKAGKSLNPKHKDLKLYGHDLRTVEPKPYIDLEFFLEWYKNYSHTGREFITRPDWLDKLMGTDSFRKMLQSGASAKEIRSSWQAELTSFKTKSQKYKLYE